MPMEQGPATDLDPMAPGLWTISKPQVPSIDSLPPAGMGTVQGTNELVSQDALAERAALGERFAEPAEAPAVAPEGQFSAADWVVCEEELARGGLAYLVPLVNKADATK